MELVTCEASVVLERTPVRGILIVDRLLLQLYLPQPFSVLHLVSVEAHHPLVFSSLVLQQSDSLVCSMLCLLLFYQLLQVLVKSRLRLGPKLLLRLLINPDQSVGLVHPLRVTCLELPLLFVNRPLEPDLLIVSRVLLVHHDLELSVLHILRLLQASDHPLDLEVAHS